MDLSTIDVKFGWAVEETAGTKPKAFTWIKRCSKIAGINVTKDKIDVSCFEDKIKQYIAEKPLFEVGESKESSERQEHDGYTEQEIKEAREALVMQLQIMEGQQRRAKRKKELFEH